MGTRVSEMTYGNTSTSLGDNVLSCERPRATHKERLAPLRNCVGSGTKLRVRREGDREDDRRRMREQVSLLLADAADAGGWVKIAAGDVTRKDQGQFIASSAATGSGHLQLCQHITRQT